MAHWRKMMDSNSEYVGAWDLNGDTTVTIKEVKTAKVKNDKGEGRKLILIFVDKPKGMISNVTNNKTISRMYGTDVDAWVGKKITLYATVTTVGGEETDCIRVRPTVKP
jgi:hypothetical protein